MTVHAEVASSKEKREQLLRNILAARRRQLLGSRNSRPIPSKDSMDTLEAQETRHGVYVTAPAIGDQMSTIVLDNQEQDQDSANFMVQTYAAESSSGMETVDKFTRNSMLIEINDTAHWLSPSGSKTNEAYGKNASSIRGEKTLEHEIRRKNTVAMSDSLYNHFRPVESNIPVEDMTQFLYFGQKIQLDGQNNSSSASLNNSLLDATSSTSSATVPSSRRRNSMKRFGTTTPITMPVPRLEEIVNQEMSIALEAGTIERNKIPKTKTVFRATGAGTYFRKASPVRSSDPIVVSNVISTRESSRNAATTAVVSEDKREDVLLRNSGEFYSDPSAHAHRQVLTRWPADRGSSAVPETAAAAVAHHEGNVTTGNAAHLTQLHKSDREREHRSSRDSATNSTESDSFPAPDLKFEKTDTRINDKPESTTLLSETNPDDDSTMTSIDQLASTVSPKSFSILPTVAGPAAQAGSLRIVVTEPMVHQSVIESVGDRPDKPLEHVKIALETIAVIRGHSREAGNSFPSLPIATNTSLGIDSPVESAPSILNNSPSDSPVKSHESAKTETKQPQQHAYAYEITNVTRLLRNYTGPGLNAAAEQSSEIGRREAKASGKKEIKVAEQEETRDRGGPGEEQRVGGSALRRTNVGSIEEMRNVDGSGEPTPQQRQPLLPLLLPTLQRPSGSSGGVAEPARTLGRLSGGTNVGEATASSTSGFSTDIGVTPIITSAGAGGSDNSSASGSGSSSSGRSSQTPSSSSASSASSSSSSPLYLVGERGRKVAVGARQPHNEQNRNRASGGIGSGTEVSGATTAALDDYATSASNEDRERNNDDGVTESALPTWTIRWNHNGTKKGGAASGSMRKPVSAVPDRRIVEEVLVKDRETRRGSVVWNSAPSANGRRVKSSRIGASEDSRLAASRSTENRTVLAEIEGPATITSEASLALHEDAIGKVVGKLDRSSVAMNRTVTSSTTENLRATFVATTVVPQTTLESPATRLTQVPNERANNVETSVNGVQSSNSNSSIVSGAIETSERTNGADGDDDDDDEDDEIAVSTTKFAETTTPPAIADAAAPVFPVTPRMLRDSNEPINKDETTELARESADESSTKKTLEADRPFGLAEDLDPSEIQKMYRSRTSGRAETTMGTMSPEIEQQPGTEIPFDTATTRRPAGSGERSPEVRGRNLSDKSKDKDDVLPIMQLYNTSDMFNGTGKNSPQEAVNGASSAAVLPGAIEVNSTRRRNDAASATTTTTTLEPETSESFAKERNDEAQRRTVHKHRDDNNSAAGGTKISRNGDARDEARETVAPTRWSNQSNPGYSLNSASAQLNGTRHRTPGYYPITTPEFVAYPGDFNASFFEPGIISVSPRESINISQVITKRHEGDTIASQETVAVVAYILATLVVFPIAVGVGLILRRLIIRNRKVLEESDTSSEISCRKDAPNLENGDLKTSIEKAITKLPRIQHLCHEAEKAPPPPPPSSQESRWEFPRDKLRLQTVLGQGNFGQVWKAEADDLTGHQGTTRLVAVKTVKEGASAREKEDLVRELEIMQQLGNHPNVVTLLGCCTEEEPHYLILEYVMYGKLLAYLRDHRTRQDFYNFSEDSAALTSRDLTVFGYCVARGMEYLASKKIIHRDLAARNVLVDHNKLCKIADFGMSRFANEDGEVIEARHGRNALPIRWMAPESLIYSLFTTKTDVWSFGILMWEIVTLGSTPYPDMAAREVMRNVQNGYRLERPSHCRCELFRVIARCWHADPDRRPEFQTLRRDMAQLLEDSMNGHYVDLESFASECTD